jgi:hypothetical protein
MKNAVFCSLGFCVHHTELQSRPHTSSSLRWETKLQKY